MCRIALMLMLMACLMTWPAAAQPTGQQSLRAKLLAVIEQVEIHDATAREALAWWARTTGVPVTVDWEQMELYGVSPDTPVNVRLAEVPAAQALGIIVQQLGGEYAQVIVEVSPWDVQVMTKQQANLQTVLRVYDIADLVIQPRNAFRDAPQLDLAEALGGGDANGGGGGGGSLFGDDDDDADDDADEDRITAADRGEAIAQMVRDTIEPTIWQAHGGTAGSVRYWNGRLIVRAPLYVHRQIGMPVRARPQQISPGYAESRPGEPRPARRSNGVSGVSGVSNGGGVSSVR